MNISYDIFELTDCPVIITDKDLVITYKNRLVTKLFCGFRKRSKISRYFRNFKNDVDFSDINELDIETGTQFMRALVLPIGENTLAFLFFTLYAFTDSKKLIEYVREKFSGNFIDFYCAACREFTESKLATRNIPERAFSELLSLTYFFSEKPVFMKTEVYNIAEILEGISSKTAKSLSVFGLSTSLAEIPEKDCYASINLRLFCFIVFRMLYMAFRLSGTGRVQISLDAAHYSSLEICISTHAVKDLPITDERSGSFAALAEVFPVFSFEFDIFKQSGFFDNMLTYSFCNSTLKLRYTLKRETGATLTLRSQGEAFSRKRIASEISATIAQIKKLLSEK
jgi:hypothetical protein